jgi:hypothetical protein
MSHAQTTLASIADQQNGEDIMTDATRRTASGALAHLFAHAMAVTSLLVIAACIFYVR